MPNVVAFVHQTRWGRFAIVATRDGRWQAMFNDEALGSYHTPNAAHDDLIGDHCFSNSAGLDTSRVGLPDDLADWQRIVTK